MKKLIAMILTLAMLMALSACGKEKKEENKKTDTSSKPAVTSETARTETEKPSADSSEDAAVNLGMLKIRYDKEDGWSYDNDTVTDDHYGSEVLLQKKDEDTQIKVSVLSEDAAYYRETLTTAGVDLYQMVENSAYDMRNIGGVDCVQHEDPYDGSILYTGRIINAGVTVRVNIINSEMTPAVEKLLDEIDVIAQESDTMDPPWPWEGEPVKAENHSAVVGTDTLEAQWMAFDEPYITYDLFDHWVQTIGEQMFVLGDGVLQEYAIDNSSLHLTSSVQVGSGFENLDMDHTGMLLLSGFMKDYTGFQNGEQAFAYADIDKLAAAPDGAWGISYDTENACRKISFQDGTVSEEPMVFSEMDTVWYVRVDGDSIYVAGNLTETDTHSVGVYDHGGKLQMILETPDGLGSMTFVGRRPGGGFIGLDANMREVVLWDADGNYQGSAKDSDLFGTSYSWLSSASFMADGSLMVIMTEDRADASAMELIAFRLSGF